MTKEADDFLMGGGPVAKFPEQGAKVVGTVRSYEKTQQRDLDGNPKEWDNGEPMWQIVFVLETDERDPETEGDDGTRRLFAKGQMLNAIREAVKATGRRGDLIGGKLGVVYAKDGEQTRKGYNAPKVYTAKFEAPAQTDDLGDAEDETY